MTFNFDRPIARENTDSVKYDSRKEYFGTEDVTPMWVADMDFAIPEGISDAIIARAGHPILGYSRYPESLYQTIQDWFWSRHNWHIERDWIMMAPGVVPSLHAACLTFAAPNEGVIAQPPVYFPFFSAVTQTQRQLLLNPLLLCNGRYEINFIELEQLAKQAKILMLCSPHNPVGRVWSTDELFELLRIAKKYNLMVVSDDIHADLVYPNYKHTMLGSLAHPDYIDFINSNVITAVAPSKTFNIPGLGLSSLIVPNSQHRKRLRQTFELLHSGNMNPFSITAFQAAYQKGGAWLDALLKYLDNNRAYASQYIAEHIPELQLIAPEGTYLLWLNCAHTKMTDEQLRNFFVYQAKIGMNPGIVFGVGGSGFMRMNIGTQRANLEQALAKIKHAFSHR